MKSNVMKRVIVDAKAVIRSGDKGLSKPHNKELITSIAKVLNAEFKRNPRTVSMIIKYIEDHGYELRHHACEHTEKSLRNKAATFEKITPTDMESIRAICEQMFSQTTKL